MRKGEIVSWRIVAGAALALLASCGYNPRPPTFTTALGAMVWCDPAACFPAERVDQAINSTLSVFANRWPPDKARAAASRAQIMLLDNSYFVVGGQKAAGMVNPDFRVIYVSALRGDLPDTALAHELVHYFDLATFGSTDNSHQSWAGAVYAGIDSVNASLRPVPPQVFVPLLMPPAGPPLPRLSPLLPLLP